ncbi:MAG TPA: translation initiation factor IF-2 subunit beta, partial [Methanomicrobia archaeon]|nr:Translation initiation factor 2 [Candidatus Alkanophaga volatiphilum]HDO64327.1 translation initiation factor IF-2 subunit beta [Methanomicrobia archaeon]HEX59920.1 translation initiation factor IF-2 subunit beta [Methanomicrobia archaeon]
MNEGVRPTEYEEMLDRALARMPEMKVEDTRFNIPEVRVFIEGKTTVFDNFASVCDYINREQEHVMKFLLRELGTAGKIDGDRAIFQGRFSKEDVAKQIRRYVEDYVLCSECGKPDTQLVRTKERVLMLKCEACGAFRPVGKRLRR